MSVLKNTLLTCIYLLVLTTVSAQDNDHQFSLWLNGGWGAGDGPHVNEDYTLLSIGAQLRYGHKILLVRAENGWDFANKTKRNYNIEEYKMLCGYVKEFAESDIYIATGISYANHQYRGQYLSKEQQIDRMESTSWGWPIELGFKLNLGDRLGLGGATFANINNLENYIGYLIQLQIRIF